MGDCKFCKDNPLKAADTPVWCIGFPVPQGQPTYLRYNTINFAEITPEALRFSIRFTPKARLTLNGAQAEQLIAHDQAWQEFLKDPTAQYGAFYEQAAAATKEIALYIENTGLPRDWDIVLVSPTDYLLNKRAARVLAHSATQFHVPLIDYLQAFGTLKVVNKMR